MTWWFKEMLLHLVPYLINFCFSDAEEKQNKESVIETNTLDSGETITNSWENREGGRGNMSRDLVMLLWAVYNTRDAKGDEGWWESKSEGGLAWVREDEIEWWDRQEKSELEAWDIYIYIIYNKELDEIKKVGKEGDRENRENVFLCP